MMAYAGENPPSAEKNPTILLGIKWGEQICRKLEFIKK